ncbi:MAG TPA: PEGA domain-containing protein [Kofleriaceae bacterium]|nr:PEGA domain-containing protein [Kofleriaceae bacterium]
MKKLAFIVVLASSAVALAGPNKDKPAAGEQKEADKHFKAGVALFKEAKYGEALAEFERAYEIAPHPLVLYNIATCHRELSHYGEAVKFYRRFIKEAPAAKVSSAKIKTAQSELDGVLARIARVSVSVSSGAGTELLVDGISLGTAPFEEPIILPPGEHKLTARAVGHKDAERTVRVASGDEVEVTLTLGETPAETKATVIEEPAVRDKIEEPVAPTRTTKRFSIGAAFGTNLLEAGDTGAPTLGLGVAINDRIQVGVDAVVVAYAVMPSVRVRLAGNAVSVHLAAAMPISITDDGMSETFVAGAVGLGLRYRPMPSFSIRLESFASFAGKTHGTTLPAFVGGELWF